MDRRRLIVEEYLFFSEGNILLNSRNKYGIGNADNMVIRAPQGNEVANAPELMLIRLKHHIDKHTQIEKNK